MADAVGYSGNERLPKRFKDMGDGTFAEVMVAEDPSVSAAEVSVQGAAVIAPSDTVTVAAGRAILINSTVAGNVKVKFVDNSTITIPVQVGVTIFPWAIVQVFVTGTTATATYFNLL